MLTRSQRSEIEILLEDQVLEVTAISGGDINSAAFIRGKNGSYFFKYNSYSFGQQMLKSEAHGLTILANYGQMVPEVIVHGHLSGGLYGLILQWLEPSALSVNQAEKAGRQLALQHGITNETFGFEKNNFLATFPQDNEWIASWPAFYLTKRVEPLLKACIEKGYLPHYLIECRENIRRVIEDEFPKVRPSLLHGDLWSGNLHPTADGNCYYIDPAVYFGDRESDIAMTRLFGGFPQSFYKAYEEVSPLDYGWEERLEIYQLYYLLYHLYKFGRSYEGSVRRIIDSYI